MTGAGEGRDRAERDRALREALEDALASVHDRGSGPDPESVDYRSLGIGMRLGLDRPGHARHLLALIEAGGAEAPDAPPVTAARGEDASEDDVGKAPGGDDPEASAPVLSLLLARSAALPRSEIAAVGPGVVFGWADELTASQVLAMGRVVMGMLADGTTPNVGRGFGLAWDDGVRIPRPELDMMFADFTQLQVAVGGVLVGRDLRAEDAATRRRGLGALARVFGGGSGSASPANSAIEAAGEPGRRGLVALWNTWAAMRFRDSIPEPTFALLTSAWVSVVGRLREG